MTDSAQRLATICKLRMVLSTLLSPLFIISGVMIMANVFFANMPTTFLYAHFL